MLVKRLNTATSMGPPYLLQGTKGYITADDEDKIYEHFPNAELQTIDGAGHWVHAEAREAFAECRCFLGSTLKSVTDLNVSTILV